MKFIFIFIFFIAISQANYIVSYLTQFSRNFSRISQHNYTNHLILQQYDKIDDLINAIQPKMHPMSSAFRWMAERIQ